MFLFFPIFLANNARLLSVLPETRFLAGSVGNAVHMVDHIDFAHLYTYKRVQDDDSFTIEVTHMPKTYWTVLDDNTIGYRFLHDLDRKNIFKLVMIFNTVYFNILYEGKCLQYDPLRDKLTLELCNSIDGYQTFVAICDVDGEIILDEWPGFEFDESHSLVEEHESY
ncbi:hypothetical protein GVAV_000323 [Gurleya vavrai]